MLPLPLKDFESQEILVFEGEVVLIGWSIFSRDVKEFLGRMKNYIITV